MTPTRPDRRRPDPTSLDTGGAIAVLTERIAGVQETVDKIADAIDGIPARVRDLECHDDEQDASIKGNAKAIGNLATAHADMTSQYRMVLKLVRGLVVFIGAAWVLFQIGARVGWW